MLGYCFSSAGPRPYNHDYAQVHASAVGYVVCVCDGVGDDPNSGVVAREVGQQAFAIAKTALERLWKTNRDHCIDGSKRYIEKRLSAALQSLRAAGSGKSTLCLALGKSLPSMASGRALSKRKVCLVLSLGDSRLYRFDSGGVCLTSDDVDDEGCITRYLSARGDGAGAISLRKVSLPKNTAALAAATDGLYTACSLGEFTAFVETCRKNLPMTNETIERWTQQFLGRNAADNLSLSIVFSGGKRGNKK
jgi:serine/threonine protein phosphatase PrpC